ncbi:uncharacterized protein LOC105844312 isoform X2 [Hydra vulgaris]|uniref:uncharacterized protein LOC105844312 isoform X2 n=1 Tax=Hydra vulgaris TaxID=6087 RepID=UPI0032E9DEBA
MATYSKSVLDALTENPAQLFVDFLRFLESTQPITVTSSAPTITIPCVQPPAVESTQPITATFTCSTNVLSTSAICGMFTSFYFLICLCISWQLQYLFLITTLIIFSYIFCGFYDS